MKKTLFICLFCLIVILTPMYVLSQFNEFDYLDFSFMKTEISELKKKIKYMERDIEDMKSEKANNYEVEEMIEKIERLQLDFESIRYDMVKDYEFEQFKRELEWKLP